MERYIYGVRPVTELLRRRPAAVRELLAARDQASLKPLLAEAEKRGIPVRRCGAKELETMVKSLHHQGVAARAPLPDYAEFEPTLERLAGRARARLLVLDCIQDPQNLGALVRAADGAGADGVLIPQDRSAGISPAVHSASAGALEWVPVVQVVNLRRAMDRLKEAGFWLAAAEAEGGEDYHRVDWPAKLGLVIGSEGEGIRPLVRKGCDLAVRIPMRGRVNSLNAAAAAAVLLFASQGPGGTAFQGMPGDAD